MPLRRVSWLVLLSALLLPAPVVAQTRPLPEDAKRGYIRHVQQMWITLDGNQVQLAPGAIIRGQNNLIIVPTALPPDGAWAAYSVDANGRIFRVWLLTPDELAKPEKQPAGR